MSEQRKKYRSTFYQIHELLSILNDKGNLHLSKLCLLMRMSHVPMSNLLEKLTNAELLDVSSSDNNQVTKLYKINSNGLDYLRTLEGIRILSQSYGIEF